MKGLHHYVLITEEKYEKDFCFYEKKKGKRPKQWIVCILESSQYRTPSRESSPTKQLPQEVHSASQHQALKALDCPRRICALFVLIYFMHPLARYVLMLLLLCFMHLVFTKDFIGVVSTVAQW